MIRHEDELHCSNFEFPFSTSVYLFSLTCPPHEIYTDFECSGKSYQYICEFRIFLPQCWCVSLYIYYIESNLPVAYSVNLGFHLPTGVIYKSKFPDNLCINIGLLPVQPHGYFPPIAKAVFIPVLMNHKTVTGPNMPSHLVTIFVKKIRDSRAFLSETSSISLTTIPPPLYYINLFLSITHHLLHPGIMDQ